MPPDAPLSLYETKVLPEWLDYNGHMSEAYYVLVFGYATDAFLDEIGADAAYRERTVSSVYTLEAHVTYLREASEGQPLRTATQLLDFDHKRLRVFHSMLHAKGGRLLATAELLLMHVDSAGPRSSPFPDRILSRLKNIRDAHAVLPPPEQAGRSISLER